MSVVHAVAGVLRRPLPPPRRAAPAPGGAIGAVRYGRWWGGASSRSQSSFDARRIRSSSPNLSKSSGVTCTRGGFRAARGGGSGSIAVIVSLLDGKFRRRRDNRADRAEAPASRYPHKRSVQLTVEGLVAVTGVGRFCWRWLAEAARHIIEGRSSRIGASTSQATLRNCSNAAVSYSAAVSNRSMYPLSNLVDSGGVPSISGRRRSPPAASCQAWPIGFAVARKNRRGRFAVPRDRQFRSAKASSAATAIPCP